MMSKNGLNFVLRRETSDDFRILEELTREAFWDKYQPGCDEHLLLHKLRTCPAFVPELDFVAVMDGRIVGNIVYSKAMVVDPAHKKHEVLIFGPVGVLPEFQSQGIGSSLIRHTLALARKMGYLAVIIFGDPGYYHRFGFQNAQVFGITTADGKNFDPFMALELRKDGLKGIHGAFFEDPVFTVDPEELVRFDALFPPREKHVTETQLK
jgi:predicted N-acetyltransferase YhbS